MSLNLPNESKVSVLNTASVPKLENIFHSSQLFNISDIHGKTAFDWMRQNISESVESSVQAGLGTLL